jgi:hypothetical protein
MHKPIETEYNGYRFRSRLEARWAVFFDALEIKYQYEHEGYETSDDFYSEKCRYLPDFYLPECGTFVEVKGVMDERSAKTLARIVDWASPMPYICDSADMEFDFDKQGKQGIDYHKYAPGILLLGDIPFIDHGHVFHKIIQHHKGIIVKWSYFKRIYDGSYPSILSDDALKWINRFSGLELDNSYQDSYQSSDDELITGFNPQSKVVATQLADFKILEAYKKARQARFEHGETPCP